MPTTLVSCGPPTTLTQNQVYAVPAVSCDIQSTIALESALLAVGPWTAFTSALVTGAFIRCTTGNAVVTLRQNAVGLP
jgi:hypothetical protein